MNSRSSSYNCLRPDIGVSKLCPFFKIIICAYRESVTILLHSFQVSNMIFIMFWLIFGDKEGIGGIFITMNDSSIYFDIQTKTVVCNLQEAVWKWVMDLPKQLKSRSFSWPYDRMFTVYLYRSNWPDIPAIHQRHV